MVIRIILNGKKAGLESVRTAIFMTRESGVAEVRSTWKSSDVKRLVQEAKIDGCQRIIVAGGGQQLAATAMIDDG